MFDFEKTEKNILNLFGLVTAIKSSAENLSRTSGGDGDDVEQLDKHIECVIELCEISRDKLSCVWRDVSDIETPDDETPESFETEDEVIFERKTLAEMIASVLAYPEIPEELFDAIVEGLDVVADKGRFKTLRKLENSPEYISKILSDYAEVESE